MNCWVPLTPTLAVAGVTLMQATGALVTLTVAFPETPEEGSVAITPSEQVPVVPPAVKMPFEPPMLPRVQEGSRLQAGLERVMVLPLSSLPTAVNCPLVPTLTLALLGETTTAVTGPAVTTTEAKETTPVTEEVALMMLGK